MDNQKQYNDNVMNPGEYKKYKNFKKSKKRGKKKIK
jgi:hypothetical protein